VSDVWHAGTVRILAVEVGLMMAVYISVYFLDACKNWHFLFNSFDPRIRKKNDDYASNSFDYQNSN
jgi:hypothetical protein